MLSDLKSEVGDHAAIDSVGITMTAELADSYRTKREGVNKILTGVEKAFHRTEVLILTVDGRLVTMDKARQEPLQVAAANWTATGWMVSQLIKDCIVLDTGSTTTSIIPIARGENVAQGKTDLEKLMNGELVYTGSLRTNVAAIVHSIPIRNHMARVASELFAQSGDVHLLLGNIGKEDYTVETANGRGKTREEAMTRLARVLCSDTETLNEREILRIAKYVCEKQVEQVATGLSQVYNRTKKLWRKKPIVVVTGLGRNFLARKAAEKLSFSEVQDLEDLTKHDISKVSTAVATSLLVASKVEGGSIAWTL